MNAPIQEQIVDNNNKVRVGVWTSWFNFVNLIFRVAPFNNLPTYANNAAAVAAGLPVGNIYKTATGEVRVVV